MATGAIVEPIFNHAMDQVDKAVEAALKVVDLAQNAAFETGEQVLAKADSEADGVVVEVRALKDRIIKLIRDSGDAAVSALP